MAKLAEPKYGFVILAPEHNVGKIFSTVNCIKAIYPDATYICVVGSDTTEVHEKEIAKLCPVFKGDNTITSLINKGLSNGNAEWNIFLTEGAHIGKRIVDRLFRSVKNELDIVFPIIVDYDRQNKPFRICSVFPEATLNGLTIHTSTFQKIGQFQDHPLEISKLLWSLDATEAGCRFKGILGTKIL